MKHKISIPSFQFDYDKDYDIIYFSCSKNKTVNTTEVHHKKYDIRFDWDKDNNVVGIEIDGVEEYLKERRKKKKRR